MSMVLVCDTLSQTAIGTECGYKKIARFAFLNYLLFIKFSLLKKHIRTKITYYLLEKFHVICMNSKNR